jgi:methylmalonic aciduria homocystinuria type C protein
MLSPMHAAWQTITEQVAQGCRPAGLDLVQPFQVAWYNDAVDPAYRLPDFGNPRALGILIGNTRALWPALLAALRSDPALRDVADVVDHYTTARVGAVLQPLSHRCAVRWSYDRPPRRVAMQRLGHLSGLAHLSRGFLNVHPVYGPWIALRAAVVVDTDGPPGPPPDPPSPCSDCEHTCVPLLERAAAALRARGADRAGLGDTWPLWLAVRDACPVGRAHRYSDAQIAYHYAKDRRMLEGGAPSPPAERS